MQHSARERLGLSLEGPAFQGQLRVERALGARMRSAKALRCCFAVRLGALRSARSMAHLLIVASLKPILQVKLAPDFRIEVWGQRGNRFLWEVVSRPMVGDAEDLGLAVPLPQKRARLPPHSTREAPLAEGRWDDHRWWGLGQAMAWLGRAALGKKTRLPNAQFAAQWLMQDPTKGALQLESGRS